METTYTVEGLEEGFVVCTYKNVPMDMARLLEDELLAQGLSVTVTEE